MKVPASGFRQDGKLVTITRGKHDDLTVTEFDGKTDKDRELWVTHFSHHSFAVARFKTLTGLTVDDDSLRMDAPTTRVRKPNDGHECDWDWVNPDDPQDLSIRCNICGAIGEGEV